MADEPTGTEGTEPTSTEPTGTEPATEPSGSSPQDKTFTQAELDAVVKNRLAREREKFTDYDELKAAKAKLDELELANASDLEKAQARAEAAEAKVAEALASAKDTALRSAIIAEAAKQGVTSTDAVLRALDREGLTIGDDGQVSGVEEAVKSLLAEFPAFVGKVTHASADQGARGSAASDQLTAAEVDSMSAEQIQAALKEGRLNDVLQG